TACAPNEGKPVGHVTLCDEISDNITQLLGALPQSEFLPRLEQDLRETYKAGAGFAEAFGKLSMRFLGTYGIVMIDPLDEKVKDIAGTIYQRAIAQAP